MKKIISVLLVLCTMVTLTTPSLAYSQYHTEADGKFETEYENIYVDNNGVYYVEEADGPVYLEKITLNNNNRSSIGSLVQQYNIPQEIEQDLLSTLDSISDEDTISLFVPYTNTMARGTSSGWGGEYNYTYGGVTFRLKEYFVHVETRTPTTVINRNDQAMQSAKTIYSLSVIAGATYIGLANFGAGLAVSIADIILQSNANFPVSGATGDLLEAKVSYKATTKYTYVLDTANGWQLRMKTSTAILDSITFTYFKFSTNVDYEGTVSIGKAYASPNYYNANQMSVTTTMAYADSDLEVKIGNVSFALA